MVDIDVDVDGMAATRQELREIEADWTDDHVVYLVGPTVEYAVWVEFGRGPVEAEDADALRFEVGGETIFRKRVGPADPQPFMRPALRKTAAEADLIAASSDSLEETVKKLALTLERHAKQEAPVDDGPLRASIGARRIQ